mgnify:CR=1 FL=1|jgi:hypothetical protein
MNFDVGRLARTVGLIAAVSAVFLLTTAERFGTDSRVFPAAVVSVGAISLLTAMTAFIISVNEYLEESELDRG